MALGSCLYQSLCVNPVINLRNNQLIGNLPKALIKSISSPALTFWFFSYSLTLGLTFVLTQVKYIDENLQKTFKHALESFIQGQ